MSTATPEPGHIYQEPVDVVDHTKGADLDPYRAEEEAAEAAAAGE